LRIPGRRIGGRRVLAQPATGRSGIEQGHGRQQGLDAFAQHRRALSGGCQQGLRAGCLAVQFGHARQQLPRGAEVERVNRFLQLGHVLVKQGREQGRAVGPHLAHAPVVIGEQAIEIDERVRHALPVHRLRQLGAGQAQVEPEHAALAGRAAEADLAAHEADDAPGQREF
jgi:hypothetical protein